MLADKLRAASFKESGAIYVEDVFSTYLYTGTGAAQTITNGIDISGKGGLVWVKQRDFTRDNNLYDTARGATQELRTNSTGAESTDADGVTAFNNSGFSVGTSNQTNILNGTFASWTFRKQAKFFDVVTYTGNGIAGHTVAHNLESIPGCIVVKRLDLAGSWVVYHRSLTSTGYSLTLNTAEPESTTGNPWNSTAPTSSVFSVGNFGDVNASGGTYVAYLFAHDSGGFGDLGTDNIISCGSYAGNGSNAGGVITTLGWEPQWLLVKRRNSGFGDWIILDTPRRFSAGLAASTSHSSELVANTSAIEAALGAMIPMADGFRPYGFNSDNVDYNSSGSSYIYIAIRRGPMRVPTSGSEVLGLNARTGTGANATVTGGQLADLAIIKNRGAVQSAIFAGRMTTTGYMSTTTTTAETAAATTILQANPWDVMDGVKVGTTSAITNASGNTFINYLLRRAPKFYDSLSYIFPSPLVATRIPHNLTIPPEMIIAKSRTGAFGWYVYHKDSGINAYVRLNTTNVSVGSTGMWGTSGPTDYDFGINPTAVVATAGATAIFYLFATCPGVSKVGSYVGTTSTAKQIDCGFTTGARFVLIKRLTGVAGDWYLWDSARGISPVGTNDPYYLVNTTGAEVTSTDYLNTYSAGFELTAAAPAALNTTGSTFIFLAIA